MCVSVCVRVCACVSVCVFESARIRVCESARKQGVIKISFDGQLSKPWFASTEKREIPKGSGLLEQEKIALKHQPT